MTSIKIVYVEDNDIHADLVRKKLEQERNSIGASAIQFAGIETESEFVEQLPELREHPPDLVLIDVMLRWQNAASVLKEVPPDVKSEGFWRAGLRCYERLRAAGMRCPVVLYTVASDTELKEEFDKWRDPALFHLEKSKSLDDLVGMIKRALRYGRSSMHSKDPE